MKNSNMLDRQMELGFGNARVCPPIRRRQQRQSRACWWFARMREVVDHAIDWRETPAGRPEQICFPGAFRQPALAPVTASRRGAE